MEWHIFSEAERRSPAPSYRLPTDRGDTFALDDHRGWGNAVLLFTHGPDCPHCRAALVQFAQRRLQYGAQEAKIIPVVPGSPADLKDSGLPFARLADAEGRLRRRYADLLGADPETDVMLFVIDRYGAIYAGAIVDEPDRPDLHDETLDWLEFIEVQCPE